jgi:hypothetical protein
MTRGNSRDVRASVASAAGTRVRAPGGHRFVELLAVGVAIGHVPNAARQWDWPAVRVDLGLWEPAPGRDDGWLIHNYLVYQPSRAQVFKQRDDLRAAHVQGGKTRAATAARNGGRFASEAPAMPNQHSTSYQAGPDLDR